jgi:hypothetical protein
VRANLVSDLALEILDLRVQRPDHRHEAEHQLPAGSELQLPNPRAGGRGGLRLPGSSWNFDGDPTGIVMVRR